MPKSAWPAPASRRATRYQYRKSEEALSLDGKIALIREAIAQKAKLSMTYLKANDTKSERIVVPITVGIAFIPSL